MRKISPSRRQAALDNLKQARDLIRLRTRWVRGVWRNTTASGVEQFCALGAIERADGKGEDIAKEILANSIHQLFPRKGWEERDTRLDPDQFIFTFNDDKKWGSHKKVIAAFDHAIESLTEPENK